MIHRVITYIAQLDISPLPASNPESMWRTGVLLVSGIMAVVAILLIVMNGFSYITASGDPQKTAQARMGILYAVIGLVVVLMAATIVSYALRGIQ